MAPLARSLVTRRLVVATALVLLAPAIARAQAGPPILNAVSNPCAFDAGLGRSGRCATAGQVVSWSVFAQNPDSSNPMLIGVRDPAPTPAGCMTFTCDPILLVNGSATPLPAGSTCDAAAGFNIPGISVPGGGWLEVQFQATLSGSLTPGNSCENLAFIDFPWGPVATMEPMTSCQVDRGGNFPTILDICGGSTGSPDFVLVKTTEAPGGGPLADIDDGAPVCWRLRVENTGTAAGTVYLNDPLDPRLTNLVQDPAEPLDTGTCGFDTFAFSCTGVTLAPGAVDETRICATLACAPPAADLCNLAQLVVTDPPTGAIVSSRPCPSCPTGPACVPVRAPDFAGSAKTATYTDTNGDGCLSTGDVVSFEVTVTNSGNDVATSVTYADPDPPEGADAGTCTLSVGGGAPQPCGAPPFFGVPVGTVAPGDPPAVIRWSVTITSALPSPQWCDQGGFLQADECDAGRGMADTCLWTCADPEVQGTKECSPASVLPGEEVVATIEACNTGVTPVSRLVISDPIPPCAEYVPGSLRAGLSGGSSSALSDAADGDGGTASGAPVTVSVEVQDLLGRPLDPGECVTATFRVTATTCPTSGFVNVAFLEADRMSRVNTSGCLVEVRLARPAPSVWKSATPDPVVAPGGLVTWSLRTCNAANATADATNVEVTDDIPACIDYEPGTLRADGRRLTDAADGDAAELAGSAVVFRASRLAPGECTDFTWQGRASQACGGTLVTNRASFTADDVAGPLSSNETATAIATYTLEKSGADVDGGRLVAGDEVQWSIRYCNGSPLDLLQVDVTDFIPSLAGTPASDCPVTYVPESMTVQVDGQPEQPLTDATLDDLAHYDPGPPAFVEVIVSPLRAATCFVVRFRVRLDAACLPGDCVRNAAHAQFTSPLQDIDSNVATTCTGALVDGQLMRGVGVASLVPTGGCERGPRLLEFACSELPGTCRNDIPGTRWTLLRDGDWRGEPVTFYELPGDACCTASPSDDARLVIRKEPGTLDLVAEILPSCN